MKKMVLGVALALLPTVGFTGLYEAEKITTVEQAKEQLLKRIESYWENPEEACHSSGRYRFKDATVDYPIEECLKDAGILFTQVKNEKEAYEQAKIKRAEEAKQKEESDLAAKQTEQQNLEADLKSGKREVQSNEEAMIAYDAAPIGRVMISPKIKPDGTLYGGPLKINQSSNESYFIAEADYNAGIKYAKIIIPEELKENYLNTAQIGKFSSVIGKYTDNL